jgi:probable F420-dependent oxidoreductase
MVVPHRPAVLTAKILSTIDVLSGGRLTLGIGAGWMKEEFEAIGAPDFAARGKVTDEYVEAFKALWTSSDPRYQGEHVRFAGIAFEPKPVQKPHPPIWVGGESGPALRRTARLGDAWYPIGTNPSFPLDSLKRFKAAIGKLRALTAEAGRDPASVGVALRVSRHGEGVPATAGDGERHLFSGTAADLAADLRTLRDLGIISVDFNFGGASVEEALGKMQAFRREVVAKV